MNAPNAGQPPGCGLAAAVPALTASETTAVLTTTKRASDLRISRDLPFLRLPCGPASVRIKRAERLHPFGWLDLAQWSSQVGRGPVRTGIGAATDATGGTACDRGWDGRKEPRWRNHASTSSFVSARAGRRRSSAFRTRRERRTSRSSSKRHAPAGGSSRSSLRGRGLRCGGVLRADLRARAGRQRGRTPARSRKRAGARLTQMEQRTRRRGGVQCCRPGVTPKPRGCGVLRSPGVARPFRRYGGRDG